MELPEKYRTDSAIIQETANQVVKDFAIKDFELKLSGNPYFAFDELVVQLMPLVERLFREDPQLFQSLLYRIDIPEKDYKRVLAAGNKTDFGMELSELIIRREFQKVITRRYFSEKPPKGG
jgi:hypothetical protein